MTLRFVPLRRIAALSVTITLFAAPIASAQTPAPASTSDAPTNTALLSPAALARLIQLPAANVAPASAVADAPRPSLLRQASASMVRDARATAAKAPQQRSWASRHKWAIIVPAAIATGVLLTYWGLCGGSFSRPSGCE